MSNVTFKTTMPMWMHDLVSGLAAGNLIGKNELINAIIFVYIVEHKHLFSKKSQMIIEAKIKERGALQ